MESCVATAQSWVEEICLATTALHQLEASRLSRPLSLSSETEARALAVIPSFSTVLSSLVQVSFGNLQPQEEHLEWREGHGGVCEKVQRWEPVISRPGQSQKLLYKHLRH